MTRRSDASRITDDPEAPRGVRPRLAGPRFLDRGLSAMSGGSMAASLRRPRRPLDGAGDLFEEIADNGTQNEERTPAGRAFHLSEFVAAIEIAVSVVQPSEAGRIWPATDGPSSSATICSATSRRWTATSRGNSNASLTRSPLMTATRTTPRGDAGSPMMTSSPSRRVMTSMIRSSCLRHVFQEQVSEQSGSEPGKQPAEIVRLSIG